MLRMDRDAAIDLLRDAQSLVDSTHGAAADNDPGKANAYAQAAMAKAVSALAVVLMVHADQRPQA